ncbi:hypothetical protein BC835DRAFT_1306082 [Cytidiella melzeri]|nr:hypothetical protein BC835DRAFT_1306082 [Cytidiella melzeri]
MPGLEATTLNRCPTFGCPGANTELQLQTVSPKSRTAKPGNHGHEYYSLFLLGVCLTIFPLRLTFTTRFHHVLIKGTMHANGSRSASESLYNSNFRLYPSSISIYTYASVLSSSGTTLPLGINLLNCSGISGVSIISIMPNSYHPKYNGEQEHYLRKLKEEEQKKEQKLCKKQEVTVHCWLKDGKPPTHNSFQGESGAASKFMFSRSHLKTLGLIDNGTVQSEPTWFRIHHPEHGYWLGASEGYIALVPPGRHLFVAASQFRQLSEIDPTIAHFSVKETPSHLRTGLQKERASVRAQSHSAAAE